ncbi:PVC-type heme-binding CxxCH protein [Pleomorphovibrio marinus]|uniref:PVC-type heme-binding CxxCH protein n=1 Tax=Pleomorphovibrio marinus TaxID=2164132 RepID=UPI000E09F913|nr:PVC-type heme-binding CxxCH protein [Pleomorphovibrio marinus]
MKYLFYLVGVSLLCHCGTPSKYPEALSPEASMATFELHEDFEIEVFASEPHVWDPVDIVFDEDGAIYVVEMPDYPYPPEEGKGKGRIKLLKDSNGDGRIDHSLVFAEGLPDATSVLPWKGGILVTSAPHIFYLKDTDGDGKADSKEILFSGFFDNNSEAQITNLRFGVDNWIYAANNGQAGEVSFARKTDGKTLDTRGADFRFRLDRDKFELESGTAQFGQTFDDWNNKFFTQNTLHIQQTVIPRRYLERHDGMPSKNVNHNVSDHDFTMYQLTPPPYWRAERTRRRNIQYEEQGLDRVEHADKYFTGASGGTYYYGDAFGEDYYGHIFTGDVAGNLIHRDIIRRSEDGSSFVASRPEDEKDREFLASTDPWFRPVGFTVGPDGYLYVVDFYRQHIETPVSIPEDLKEDMDFMHGEEHGRIYRIKPKRENKARSLAVNLSSASPEELISLLAHPNGWYRLQAQRLLVETPKKELLGEVISISQKHEDARARLHAAYVVEAWEGLSPGFVGELLEDNHPEVRRHALMLAEQFPSLKQKIVKATNDTDASVVFQAALSLGNFQDRESTQLLAKLLHESGDSKWFRMAVLSSPASLEEGMLISLLETGFFESDEAWKQEFTKDLALAYGQIGNPDKINQLIGFFESQHTLSWSIAIREGLIKGLQTHQGENEALKAVLEQWKSQPEKTAHDLSENLLAALKTSKNE